MTECGGPCFTCSGTGRVAGRVADSSCVAWGPRVGDRVRAIDGSEGTVERVDARVAWDDGETYTHEATKLRPATPKGGVT